MIYGKTYSEWSRHRESWRERFAFFPVTLDDGRGVWLQRYLTREVYHPERPFVFGLSRWDTENKLIGEETLTERIEKEAAA